MADALRIAVVQLSGRDDVQRNLHRAAELVAQAAADSAKIVVLPKTSPWGPTRKARGIAERLGEGARGPILAALGRGAARVCT
jgi:predicted amidohydrolase